MRRALLAGSSSRWLRERASRYPFVRRSVSRFMPGEELDDALSAARGLSAAGVPTILTRLGENLPEAGAAAEVTRHYLDALDRIAGTGLDAQISVKPTQLGLDQDREACFRNLIALVARADERDSFVWIDMEGSPYVDPTLDLFRRARGVSGRVGVCLQAYLRRTPRDLDALLPLAPAIRLVKGAYMEPPEVAFQRKAEVDEAFFDLATRLLAARSDHPGGFLGIATHDARLIARLESFVAANAVPRESHELEMLYGIQRGLQSRLVGEGLRLRVLISYGEYWFPWYMRRLAERPANVLFVVKSLLAG